MTNTINQAQAFPPCDFIKEEMEARGWNQIDLATVMGKSPKTIHMLLSGKVPINPETANLLAEAFGTSAEYWMNLQVSYHRWRAHQSGESTVARRAKLYSVAPIRLMQNRGWIEDTSDLQRLEQQVCKFFGRSTLDEVASWDLPHAARRSSDYAVVDIHLRTWLARASQIARAMPAREFSEAKLADALARLQLLMQDPEEIRHVPKVLADHGIRFIILEHLPKTKIDGACFWLDPVSPVVVLSLRHDRLDYFWFTLIHELGHVKAKDDASIDTDLVGKDAREGATKTAREQCADSFAESFLIPAKEIDGFIARVRPLYSKDRIKMFAKRLQIHPAIVVGQLQYRGEIPFYHSRDMLDEKTRDILLGTAMHDGWGDALPI